MSKKLKEVVIDRSKWVCGDESSKIHDDLGGSKMLNSKGRMCCLGHICDAYGVPAEMMLAIGTPTYIRHPGVPEFLINHLRYNSPLTERAVSINDSGTTSPEDMEMRESRLKKLFEDHIKLRFVGQLLSGKKK